MLGNVQPLRYAIRGRRDGVVADFVTNRYGKMEGGGGISYTVT